ncbi:glycosyltransferase [Hymenobacter sp. BT186]|uniref:Glycosyltransferase n=1 Tax=Hymenobacter telluris TaxID=2816474 RepID=A0A939JDM5_9BACT|nr:glycosyltransferase [Hymenobacter telluris]MBO0359068.1 glycosyltransferase [Hymenobacter telluris]MBW3375094.1 glycosyltransferase [Hymenobacter norwichensis]
MPPLSSASGSPIRTVLLASVLKPLDDTRMYGKFGGTLAARPGTTVHVAGRAAAPPPDRPVNVHMHCLLEGSRLSWGRLAAQWRYWQLLRHLQPELVVVHAPELLPLTLLWQWLNDNRRFLYDIRENYALNVSTQQVYGGLTRRWLAAGLRWVETSAAHRAAAVLLAEASYADELPFLEALPPEQVLLLENKYQPFSAEAAPLPRPLPAPTEPLRLLYSGTISRLNGITEALALAEELHRIRPGGALLTVIGFCQQPDLLLELQQRQQANPAWLRLVVAAGPIPHRAIVAEMQQSHIGLLLYRPHASTERCRPTKLFEYLAHGLPMLIPANPRWEEVVRRYQAGVVVDLGQMAEAAQALLEITAARTPNARLFYPQGIPAAAFWVSEGVKLRALVDSIR